MSPRETEGKKVLTAIDILMKTCNKQTAHEKLCCRKKAGTTVLCKDKK